MVGFVPQGNGLQSGPQTLANRIIAHPFVDQFQANPGTTTTGYGGVNPVATPAGGGSAYTVDVLNSLQPLGVQASQYPGMSASPPPPPQNGGNQGAFSPQQQNQLNNAFNTQSGAINGSGSFVDSRNLGGPPTYMDKYGQLVYTNQPGSGGPTPKNMWSPEQLYAQGIASKLGLGNFGSYAPGGYNAPQGVPAHQMNGGMGGTMAPASNQLGVPFQNFYSTLPIENMAHNTKGQPFSPVSGQGQPQPLPVLPGLRQPANPGPMGGHYQGTTGTGYGNAYGSPRNR